MILYRVIFEYNTMIHESWQKKKVDCYSAVFPNIAGDSIKIASNLAISSIIGPEYWDEYQPSVISVEYLGLVAIEKIKKVKQ